MLINTITLPLLCIQPGIIILPGTCTVGVESGNETRVKEAVIMHQVYSGLESRNETRVMS